MKKKVFDIPFIGYDYGSNNDWQFDALIGKIGNPIIGIKLVNRVTQYSADPNAYEGYHKTLNQVISIIGEGFVVQKLDIFGKKRYKAEESNQFLQQKYSDHFEGRLYKTIDTIFLFTELIGEIKKYKFSEKSYKTLRDKVMKVFRLLEEEGCRPQFMLEKDYEHYLKTIMIMEHRDIPSLNNIKSHSDHLRIGKQYAKTISLVDVEKIELPSEISTYTYLGNSATATAVDNFSFINELEDYNLLIYNQIIAIPEQAKKQRFLEKKQKQHESAASNSPQNIIIAEEIEKLLYNISIDTQLIVEAHFSFCFSTNTMEELEKLDSLIDSKLFTKGIISSKNAYNQLELFRYALIGNVVEVKEYDFFTTTSEAGLCFFFKESYPISEESNFYLRFTDRQGVPLKVDLADLPMKAGRINNRNKFVLGPSGSGKSFLMNNIIEQYLTYNYDVVIVDTGDSYSGTSKYKGGKYIQYTEEKPITMNPFVMAEEEFNIEKMEFLTNLIFLIWQGADTTISNTQKSCIDNALLSYYEMYYNKDKAWYEEKETTALVSYLEKFNVYREDIEAKIESNYKESQTYYDILGLPYDASSRDIKTTGKALIKKYHPDSNRDRTNYNVEEFYQIFEAYEVLSDEEKRRAYNESHALISTSKEIVIRPTTQDEYDELFRGEVIKYIEKISEEVKVKELSFNSFYEYCERFFPIYLNNRKHKITEKEFNLRTFLYVLKDFYKGGRYEKTLNENADNTLFSEPFIVFEIDNVKDNPTLFPIVTLIIMDTFIQKMRLRKDRRKALIIEEAWKAIASKLMGGYILYLYKTVRKFWGETIVVTQELDDIIGNAVVKDSIINNSDTFILLDQTKFKDNFDRIASLLSLNQVEQNKIFTINNLNNKHGRSRFKEFYIKRGATGEVYGNEVAIEQYLTYTTEKPEKSAIEYYLAYNKNYDEALISFVSDLKTLGEDLGNFVPLINLYKKPLDEKLSNYWQKLKIQYPQQNLFKIIQQKLEDKNTDLEHLLLAS